MRALSIKRRVPLGSAAPGSGGWLSKAKLHALPDREARKKNSNWSAWMQRGCLFTALGFMLSRRTPIVCMRSSGLLVNGISTAIVA